MVAAVDGVASSPQWPAAFFGRRAWYEPVLGRRTRMPRCASSISAQLEQIAAVSLARAFPHRTDARSAGLDLRPLRRAAAR